MLITLLLIALLCAALCVHLLMGAVRDAERDLFVAVARCHADSGTLDEPSPPLPIWRVTHTRYQMTGTVGHCARLAAARAGLSHPPESLTGTPPM